MNIMDDKPEFDSLLGGNRDLPASIHLLKFSAARCKEIQSLKQTLSNTKGVKLAFQKLPKHMRRRIMSHNAKRLPRRLREIHLSQLKKSGMPPKQKRPSRKYRRRPRNLASEYVRRQRHNAWLETHIWHAKRFHIINKWGWRIPDRPCDKSFRACYRATAKHCLLQDISYVSCIELQGPKETLISYLKQICNSCEGLSVGAKAFVNGNREGKTTFYTKTGEAIGSVLFNWKPNLFNKKSTIWIWIHAAYYAQILDVLIDLFSINKVDCNGVKKYRNEELSVELLELKYDLNRFRLTGALSQAVLQEALKAVILTQNNSEWLKTFLENDDLRQIFAEQLDFWNSIQNIHATNVLPPHIILSMIISDPRYAIPTKRTKAVCVNGEFNADVIVPANISLGPIWDCNIRGDVKKSKISNAAINELRSQLLVPGSELETPGAPVPLMLIQRPGNLGYASGWDLIIPSGWAQPMWICLTMWGARAGGLRETNHINFELGLPDPLAPDTAAGKVEEEDASQSALEKYFRLPPNKRTNFNKFAIASPFRCNWKTLISDWKTSNSSTDFTVLRNINLLSKLKAALFAKSRTELLKDSIFNENYLIPVKLRCSKGIFNRCSPICIPKEGDLKIKNGPVEPTVEDKNKDARKALRYQHKHLLKVLKKKRIVARRSGKKIQIDVEMLRNYQMKMRELWLPSVGSGIKNSCSREIMGFITKSDFSFVMGQTAAVGYVTIGGLRMLLTQPCCTKVLVRNTTSRQYKFASIDIVT